MIKIIDKPVFPKEIKEAKADPKLLAQAVRVYLANQRQGTQSALTRAEVNRTRKKFQKQKGSGNARHGDRKAPIFVGGGIAFAPKPRDYSLNLSKKIRHLSMLGALGEKVQSKQLLVISGLDTVKKTKEVAKIIEGNALIVTDKIRENVWRAARNIPRLSVLPTYQLNAYEIIKAKKILMMEEAIAMFGEVKVKKTVSKKKA